LKLYRKDYKDNERFDRLGVFRTSAKNDKFGELGYYKLNATNILFNRRKDNLNRDKYFYMKKG